VLGLTGCVPWAREATEEQSEGSLVLISTQFQPADAPLGRPPDGGRDGEVLVGIRTEVEPFPDALQARARVVEPLGSHLLITADIGEQSIKITAPAGFPAHPNRGLWPRFDPAKVRVSPPG
jgi:ABC-type sugar transport system ATPase subunit